MTSRERNRDDWNWSLSFSSLFSKIEHGFILIVIIKSSVSVIMKGYHVAQARPGDKVTTKPDVKKIKKNRKNICSERTWSLD